MELIFHDLGTNDGQFGHLMTQGSRIAATQRPATTATGGGHTGNRLLDLVVGDQQTLVAGMAGLAPALLAGLARCWGRSAFAAKAV